jgi:hypothetical protein
MQQVVALFILTGSDYTSYWNGMSKYKWFQAMTKHAGFIGELCTRDATDRLTIDDTAAKRLVAAVFYEKHYSKMPWKQGSGHMRLKELSEMVDGDAEMLLDKLRDQLGPRVNEDQQIPSSAALAFHFARSKYVLYMWDCCLMKEIILDDPTLCGGWYRDEHNTLHVMVESSENVKKMQNLIKHTKSACGCQSPDNDGNICGKRCGCKFGCSAMCKCFNSGKCANSKPRNLESSPVSQSPSPNSSSSSSSPPSFPELDSVPSNQNQESAAEEMVTVNTPAIEDICARPGCKEEESEQMVECDQCEDWWHYHCAGVDSLNEETIQHNDFFCPNCATS